MSEYDDLLQKVRGAEEQFRFRVKELIPIMYTALREENSNMSAADVRARIQIDCTGLGIGKSIILDSLPKEAKDQEKRKPSDITISDIIEQFLKIITPQTNNWNTRKDEARAYEELFNGILTYLMKFSEKTFRIDIGEIGTTNKIQLHSLIWISIRDVHSNRIGEPNGPVDVEQVLDYLYGPVKILQNVIAVLTELAGANKEKIAKLKFALRLVKALSDDDEQEEGGVEYKN